MLGADFDRPMGALSTAAGAAVATR